MDITQLFDKEFIYLDGGFGTMLQRKGVAFNKLPEELNITNPDVVKSVQREYADAGSDIIYTCTFGVNKYKLEGTNYTVDELIKAATLNAKEVAKEKNVKVALDIGPIGKLVEPNGDLSIEEAYDIFKEQVIAGANAGADFIVIETMTDLYEMKAAILAAKENSELPILCTMTFEKNMRTFTGTCISSMALTIEGLGADAIGVNCSLGPYDFKPLIEELSKWTTLPIIAKANAGLPDPNTGEYDISPKEYAQAVAELIPFGIKFVGGCCGTTPEYIKEIISLFNNKKYMKQNPKIKATVCSPEKSVEINVPRIIGERLNPTGKKKLKDALVTGDLDYVYEQAVDQVDEGAEILDINVGVPGIDEEKTMINVVKTLQGIVSAPLQIDSNNPKVIEAALRVYGGKAIVNSVNGEEKSLTEILPIVKKYGAAVVGLTLDDDGIPKTSEKRLSIAKKILDRALSIGIKKEDVYIDCLTLTVSAEQENAANTLDAIKLVKSELGLKTVLGVSNISYGLPQRSIINHNFLQMALTCGLDLPIMNPKSAEMIEAIATYKLIMNMDKDAKEYIEKFKNIEISREITKNENTNSNKTEFDKLTYAINNGLNEQCKLLIKELLYIKEPLSIINEILIPILDEAGQKFESGKIFIPELMLCAQTSQTAFGIIKEKLSEAGEHGPSKGKIIIATVKGDVHDIGKNIVKVILENYGFEIIDLGKDVDKEIIINSAVENNVNLVGLSALMTTTLDSMKETINGIKKVKPECKVMVGGAVLTADYAKSIGADYYVKDAKESADVAKKVLGNE